MTLSKLIGSFFCIVLSLVVVAVLFLGSEKEEGGAVLKDAESFFLAEIPRSNFTIVREENVLSNEVALPFGKMFKHNMKRTAIAVGFATERASYAKKIVIRSQQSDALISCFVRVHGDQVLAMSVHSSALDEGAAVRLHELLRRAFPDYQIPLLREGSK
jgi:membrane glycosyltransferase